MGKIPDAMLMCEVLIREPVLHSPGHSSTTRKIISVAEVVTVNTMVRLDGKMLSPISESRGVVSRVELMRRLGVYSVAECLPAKSSIMELGTYALGTYAMALRRKVGVHPGDVLRTSKIPDLAPTLADGSASKVLYSSSVKVLYAAAVEMGSSAAEMRGSPADVASVHVSTVKVTAAEMRGTASDVTSSKMAAPYVTTSDVTSSRMSATYAATAPTAMTTTGETERRSGSEARS